MRAPSLAGTALTRYYHVCAFFNSREEEYDILAPFYRQGLEWGERVVNVIDVEKNLAHAACLRERGIDVADYERRGKLKIVGWDETYLQGGAFDPTRMAAAVEAMFAAGAREGHPRMRICGNMGWAFQRDMDMADLVEYEVRMNEVLARNRHPGICVYDTAWLSGSMMMNILRSHPLTLVGGVVHENPYYMPPEQLLPELQRRRAEAGTSKGTAKPH